LQAVAHRLDEPDAGVVELHAGLRVHVRQPSPNLPSVHNDRAGDLQVSDAAGGNRTFPGPLFLQLEQML
jgi:hypothetical protein